MDCLWTQYGLGIREGSQSTWPKQWILPYTPGLKNLWSGLQNFIKADTAIIGHNRSSKRVLMLFTAGKNFVICPLRFGYIKPYYMLWIKIYQKRSKTEPGFVIFGPNYLRERILRPWNSIWNFGHFARLLTFEKIEFYARPVLGRVPRIGKIRTGSPDRTVRIKKIRTGPDFPDQIRIFQTNGLFSIKITFICKKSNRETINYLNKKYYDLKTLA